MLFSADLAQYLVNVQAKPALVVRRHVGYLVSENTGVVDQQRRRRNEQAMVAVRLPFRVHGLGKSEGVLRDDAFEVFRGVGLG